MEQAKTIDVLLWEEIDGIFNEIDPMDPYTDNYTKSVDNLVKLCRARSDILNFQREYEAKRIRDEQEKRFRRIELGIEGAGIVLPLIFYCVWMNKGLRFEQTGTFTSQTFKNLFNRFRPTKVS